MLRSHTHNPRPGPGRHAICVSRLEGTGGRQVLAYGAQSLRVHGHVWWCAGFMCAFLYAFPSAPAANQVKPRNCLAGTVARHQPACLVEVCGKSGGNNQGHEKESHRGREVRKGEGNRNNGRKISIRALLLPFDIPEAASCHQLQLSHSFSRHSLQAIKPQASLRQPDTLPLQWLAILFLLP